MKYSQILSFYKSHSVKINAVIAAFFLISVAKYLLCRVLQNRLEKVFFNLNLYEASRKKVEDKNGNLRTVSFERYPQISSIGFKSVYLSAVPASLGVEELEPELRKISNALVFWDFDLIEEKKIFYIFRRWKLSKSELHRNLDFFSEQKKLKTPVFSAFFGKNQLGKDVFVNFKEDPSLAILASSGGGKTNAAVSVVGLFNRGNHPINVHFVTTKLGNSKLFDDAGVLLISKVDASDLTDLEKFLAAFESKMKRRNQFLKERNLNDIFEDTEKHEIEFLVLDEIVSYLHAGNKKIVQHVSEVLRMGRACGFFTILLSQRVSATDLPFTASEISTIAIGATQTAEQSTALIGSKKAFDKRFTRGRFCVRTQSGIEAVVVPLVRKKGVK